MARRGIDISAHQGNINLGALKNQIDFVIIRVGYGVSGTIDTKFKRNADLCKSLGIPFGFYWYSYALDESGAKKEAQHFIVIVWDAGLIWKMQMDIKRKTECHQMQH